MKLIALTVSLAFSAGAAFTAMPDAQHAQQGPGPRLPAASWAPLDTADSLWRRGRIAVSEESWDEAAEAFRQIVERYPRSAYAGDALYWEAFSLQRTGRTSSMRRAVAALEKQKNEYPDAATFKSGESSALMARVNGRLARSGDHDAAVAVSELAGTIADVSVQAATAGLAVAAEALRSVQPEIQRDLAQAQRDIARASRDMRGSRDHDNDVPEGCEEMVDDERIEALNALMQMNADQALPILKKVLQKREKCSELLRRKAVFLVSQKNSDEAVDILVQVAKTDPDEETRGDAVFWLSQTHNERAIEVFEQILLRDAPDEEMQKKAVFSLSQNRNERSQRVLRDFVRRRDTDEEVRGEAIFWLGQTHDPANAALLREIFSQLEDSEAQEKVLFSLSQDRSPENSRFLLDRAKDRTLDSDLRKTALFWAGQGGAAVKDLAEIYDNAGDDSELREQVIFTLSQRKDADAVGKLIDIARREQDRELRKQAVFWLSQSRDPRALKFLEDLINK